MEPNILRTLSYGMYAIGVKGADGPSACIVNTVMQVTNTAPLMITLSMSRDNYSCACIKEHKLFTVSVLSEDTSGAVVGALGFTSGKNGGKLTNIRHKVLREGVPVIRENICCWFLCRMVDCMESTTHTLFLAEIVAGSEHTRRVPMTYDYYRQVQGRRAEKCAGLSAAAPFQRRQRWRNFGVYRLRLCIQRPGFVL